MPGTAIGICKVSVTFDPDTVPVILPISVAPSVVLGKNSPVTAEPFCVRFINASDGNAVADWAQIPVIVVDGADVVGVVGVVGVGVVGDAEDGESPPHETAITPNNTVTAVRRRHIVALVSTSEYYDLSFSSRFEYSGFVTRHQAEALYVHMTAMVAQRHNTPKIADTTRINLSAMSSSSQS